MDPFIDRCDLPAGEHHERDPAKADGLMHWSQIFADKRYQRHDKRDKLPGWITTHLKDSHLNLSTDMLMHVAREFMRGMAQPYDRGEVGRSLLTEEQANSMNAVQAAGLA